MNLLKLFENKAKSIDATIILPEANLDERVKKAAIYCLKNKLCKLIVFGKKEDFPKFIQQSDMCNIIDIKESEKLEEYSNQLYNLRKEKGLTLNETKKLVKTPGYFAVMMIKNKEADGIVAGAKFTTADSLRPALQIIKANPKAKIVTGSTLMIKPKKPPLILGDVSLIENPSIENLAQIAVLNADFMKNVLHIEPKVAMLSYSTKGSANSDMVKKVRDATKLAKKSKYKIDGEMQLDSAVDELTAKRKGVDEQVGGKANVFIFPDLNAGNIGYKLVARFGGYLAIGPIMLGMNYPVNDLSRGCTWREVVATICLTKMQTERN